MPVNSQLDFIMKKTISSPDRSIAILLLIFAISSAMVASTYPINESWGGVASAWYVSPALLPLFISFCLFLLSITLFFRPSDSIWHDYFSGKASHKIWVICALVSFVYLLIPNIDFYLSSVLFLSLLVGRFHLASDALSKPLGFIYIVVCMFVLIALGLQHLLPLFASAPAPTLATNVADITDIIGVLGTAACIWVLHVHKVKVFLVCVWLPLLLVIGFRFLLLVPMPTEGSVILLLNEIFTQISSLFVGKGI